MVATNAQGWILVGQSIPSVIETVDIRRMVEHTCRASIWMDEYHSEPLYADDVTFIRVGLIGVPTELSTGSNPFHIYSTVHCKRS